MLALATSTRLSSAFCRERLLKLSKTVPSIPPKMRVVPNSEKRNVTNESLKEKPAKSIPAAKSKRAPDFMPSSNTEMLVVSFEG